MTALSNYLETALVNHVVRNTSYTSPTTVYVALFNSSASAAELEAGTLTNEVTGGSYARQSAAFSAPSNGATSNSGTLTWTNMPTVTVTYAAIMDASTAGNVLVYGTLTTPRSLTAGDTFTIAIGDYDLVLS